MKYPSLLLIPILTSHTLFAPKVMALPQGAAVTHGDVRIAQDAQRMVIQQASERAIVQYSDFSIGQGETVDIQQPGAQSILLNRVVGSSLSKLHGQLNSNGQVFLINPNGILVGAQAQINVGGLLLTTHDIADHDFLSNQFDFVGKKPSVIQIDGEIEVSPGSFVIVLAPDIELKGSIIAQFGKVAMIAADGASVLLKPGEWPQIQVTQATYDAWIHHHGFIQAQGGMVEITAASASDLIDRVIFHEGTTDVSSMAIVEQDDQVFLRKSQVAINTNNTAGYIDVGGVIDASGDKSDKRVDIEGEAVVVRKDARILNNGGAEQGGGQTHILADYLSVEKGAEIEAKGGAQGDGGFVELSGYDELSLKGSVDTSAQRGKTGYLLIDPRNIEINTAASTSINSFPTNGGVYAPTGNNATLDVADLLTALSTNNVTVTTADNGAGNQAGNLTLATDIDLDTIEGTPTLTLRSDNILSIGGDIEDKDNDGVGGSANIVLRATRDIQMDTGTVIDAGNGTIKVNVTNGDFIVTRLVSDASDTTAVDITVGGSIIDRNDDADNIILNGENAILAMQANSFIDRLEGKVPILSAVSTAQDVKGFSQTAAGNLQLSRIESGSAPLIGFTATTVNGDIIVRGTATEQAPGIRINGVGPLTLTPGGADSNITLDANLFTGNGNINLTAAEGEITMGATNSITSTAGRIALSSSYNQTIGLISTGSGNLDAISLEVSGGPDTNRGNDIVDAHDVLNDTVNLVAPNGGLTLINADNFVSLESTVKNFISDNLNVSQIFLNETDDLIINSLTGNITAMTLVAGGAVLISRIDTGGTIAIQADRIGEFYSSPADQLAKQNQASIAAQTIELKATTSIGNVHDTQLTAVDYLDVDTEDLSLELLGEVAADNANEIAVQQVSSQTVGDLVVSDILTPNESGRAKVFLASLNNGLDLSTTNIQLDATDTLGVQVLKIANANPVEVLLPALNVVQSWALAGLALVAPGVNTRIATNETAGAQALNALTTAAGRMLWNATSSLNLNFAGSELDMTTTNGNLAVTASGAVHVRDLNEDGNAFGTTHGDISLSSNGRLELSDRIFASDVVQNGQRQGLIDLSANVGNIAIGTNADVNITSTNIQDSTAEFGLGQEPSTQTAIRIAQNNQTGTANITIGSPSTSVNISAQGGDIYVAAGAKAVTRDVQERQLNINQSTIITAFNQTTDSVIPENTALDEVNLISTPPAAASIVAREGRKITLSSVNIAGFNLDTAVETQAQDAAEDAERATDVVVAEPVVQNTEDEQTRLSVMLDTVVPGCESGESLDNSAQCMKKQGFKEFLRSLVLGRGFPDKYKGLP